MPSYKGLKGQILDKRDIKNKFDKWPYVTFNDLWGPTLRNEKVTCALVIASLTSLAVGRPVILGDPMPSSYTGGRIRWRGKLDLPHDVLFALLQLPSIVLKEELILSICILIVIICRMSQETPSRIFSNLVYIIMISQSILEKCVQQIAVFLLVLSIYSKSTESPRKNLPWFYLSLVLE